MPEKIKPAPIANQPTNPSGQEPIVKAPDNVFGDTPELIREGLAAMDKASGVAASMAPEEPAVDAAPAPVKTEPAPGPEQTGPAAKGWAAVKLQEKKLRDERERFGEERKAARYEIDQMKAQIDKMRAESQQQATDIKGEFARDAFGTLKKHFGVTLNDLAQLALSDKVAPEPLAVDPDKKVLIEKIDRLEKMVQQSQQESQYKEYRSGVKRALASEEFAILETLPNAEQEILEVASGYARKTGEVLQPDKAAAILKKYWVQHLSAIGTHKAARTILGLPDPDENGANGKPAPRPKGPKKTLTNQMSSPHPASREEVPDNLTEHEELMRAAKLIPDDAWDNMS